MWLWYDHPHMWGIWWIFPLMFIFCILFAVFANSRMFGRRIGFCGRRRYEEIEDLKREIRDLKDEVARLKKKE